MEFLSPDKESAGQFVEFLSPDKELAGATHWRRVLALEFLESQIYSDFL